MSEDRDDAVQLAGALQLKVDDVFAHNDELRAENDSLKVAFEAVQQENVALRSALDKRTKQRDAVHRERDLLKSQMSQVRAIANETMKAIEPQPQRGSPTLPETPPSDLLMFQKHAR